VRVASTTNVGLKEVSEKPQWEMGDPAAVDGLMVSVIVGALDMMISNRNPRIT
jgi:hypothetical protein